MMSLRSLPADLKAMLLAEHEEAEGWNIRRALRKVR